MTLSDTFSSKEFLTSLFQAALDVAQPNKCIPRYLPERTAGRTIVIGAGKASAAMAQALEDTWLDKYPGDALSGVVVTRYGYAVPCQQIDILEAAHPVPDVAGLAASKRILETVSDLTAEDQVIVLISGGGSALMPLPAEGISLEEKQAINQALLKSGANIIEMNTVRRHLSALKGGRLAAACYPAKVTTLLISDVPGDDLPSIASGPTVGDVTTCHDALNIIEKYQIPVSQTILDNLSNGAYESIKPDDKRLTSCTTTMIATPQMALEAAAHHAQEWGIPSLILGDSIEGESREVGLVMAGIARQVATFDQPIKPPCVLLSGGETTVTMKGNGIGGRNVEYLLSLAISLQSRSGIAALAADTDGVDGAADIAGAIIDDTTLERAFQAQLDPVAYLKNNDAHSFFQALNDSLITGPTLTNVNDFRAIFIR
ncbi:glycerate kinase type-2 family protein [Marinomonas spartinae]|uniref:glycerate kinase type-2 family protein n=1 Tax=Marinomonas spartinae TaxID=1792290 RepID=UPI0018F18F54|nr:glycerate kinase [Marinomonas spartinae]MBJ7553069.1 glycerate kinase [Marinomonas spartinae]